MRGRYPKPVEDKRFRGNPGRQPLNQNAPKPEQTAPPCPDILKGQEREEWDYLVSELGKMRTLASSDRSIMTSDCVRWGLVVEAKRLFDDLRAKALSEGKPPPIFVIGNRRRTTQPDGTVEEPGGTPMKHPLTAIINEALDQLEVTCSRLGLKPNERSRLKVPPEGEKRSKWEGFDA